MDKADEQYKNSKVLFQVHVSQPSFAFSITYVLQVKLTM